MFPASEIVLYHGTVSAITHVDVNRGRGNKDFGRGFYMAEDREQAIGMMRKKYREAVRRSRSKDAEAFSPRLYRVVLDLTAASGLKIRKFEIADEAWLDFVLLCRECGGASHDYDLVIGPTADDDTLLSMKSYWDGLYGKPGSLSARQILLSNLEPQNLGVQYCIAKQEAADLLIKGFTEMDWRCLHE